jgi:aminocarboxymuconate-semialdehyde decarboxylase
MMSILWLSRKLSEKKQALRRRDFLTAGAAASAAGALSPQESAAQSLAGANCYAVKGPAKPWNLPQRPGPPISIDVHTHWAPPGYLKAKADLGRPDNGNASSADLERRAKWMDAHGEQMQLLSLGGFMPWQWVTPEQGANIAQIVNDAGIAAHAAMPERFIACIELPAGAPGESMKELNRVAGKPGLVAVHLPNSLASREYLFEPAFAPVLARINELKIPIFMHPLDGEPNWFADHRLADEASGVTPGRGNANLFPGLTNSIGETFEQATTASKLIVSGTLDKYPDLTVIFGHSAGAFPFVASRLEWRPAGNLKNSILSYMRRFYYDSQTYYTIGLRYMIDLVGSDRVVLGTDNMGAGANDAALTAGGPGPHSVIDQLNLPDADRDLILRGNLKKLFNL